MVLNPLDRIQAHFDEFTKKDKEIAYYVINNPREAARSTPESLVEQTKTSKAALIRFSQKIGYSGYTEFRYALANFLVSENKNQVTQNTDESPIENVVSSYSKYINQIPSFVDYEQLQNLARMILESRHIRIWGFNRTFNSANQLSQRLSKIGIASAPVNDYTLREDSAMYLDHNDLVIIFTIKDNAKTYHENVTMLHENGCKVAVITMSDSLSFKKYCDEYIVLPCISRDSSISFMDDQAIYFVFIELILVAVASEANSKQK